MKDFKKIAFLAVVLISLSNCGNKTEDPPEGNTCTETTNIYGFVFDGKSYDIVKEKKIWRDAAECAVARGGYLAEINSAAEYGAIYAAASGSANIDVTQTVSSDGGDASYVWLGGNDYETEGTWVWDGDDDGEKTPFWIGKVNGDPVDGSYTNWGSEPDDFEGQDVLGFALTDWIKGSKGQWNDLKSFNKLYFVVEYD